MNKYIYQEMLAKNNLPNSDTTSKILLELSSYLEKHPYLRVGQALTNLVGQQDLFYVTDKELLNKLIAANKSLE